MLLSLWNSLVIFQANKGVTRWAANTKGYHHLWETSRRTRVTLEMSAHSWETRQQIQGAELAVRTHRAEWMPIFVVYLQAVLTVGGLFFSPRCFATSPGTAATLLWPKYNFVFTGCWEPKETKIQAVKIKFELSKANEEAVLRRGRSRSRLCNTEQSFLKGTMEMIQLSAELGRWKLLRNSFKNQCNRNLKMPKKVKLTEKGPHGYCV